VWCYDRPPAIPSNLSPRAAASGGSWCTSAVAAFSGLTPGRPPAFPSTYSMTPPRRDPLPPPSTLQHTEIARFCKARQQVFHRNSQKIPARGESRFHPAAQADSSRFEPIRRNPAQNPLPWPSIPKRPRDPEPPNCRVIRPGPDDRQARADGCDRVRTDYPRSVSVDILLPPGMSGRAKKARPAASRLHDPREDAKGVGEDGRIRTSTNRVTDRARQRPKKSPAFGVRSPE